MADKGCFGLKSTIYSSRIYHWIGGKNCQICHSPPKIGILGASMPDDWLISQRIAAKIRPSYIYEDTD